MADDGKVTVEALLAELRNNNSWLKEVLEEHGAKIDSLSDYVHAVNRTVNNGIKERQHDIIGRLADVEDQLSKTASRDDLDRHERYDKEMRGEKWGSAKQQKEERYKMAAIFLTLTSVIGLYVRMMF